MHGPGSTPNGSLAIPAVQYLLANYPGYGAVLTVRNASDADAHTKKLRKTLAQFPDAKASVYELDLANLSDVHTFASTIITEVAEGKIPPLASIICNAYYWNLVDAAKITGDGYEDFPSQSYLPHGTSPTTPRQLWLAWRPGGAVLQRCPLPRQKWPREVSAQNP